MGHAVRGIVRRWVSAALCAAALAGCVTAPGDPPEAGNFSGSLLVLWVGEGSGKAGDGRFLFVPDPDRPLVFRRPGGRTPGAEIAPGMMYTDGGSIPKAVQFFNGLSPWGYAPAYMVHDWLFTVHHCWRLDKDDPAYAPYGDIDFEDSYRILDEAIETLVRDKVVKRNDVARSAITNAVASPVARRLWDGPSLCELDAISSADRDKVTAFLNRRNQRALRAAPLADAPSATADGGAVKVVGTATF